MTAKFGIDLKKAREHPSSKLLDFEFWSDERCVFVAELKTITRYPPSEETGWDITHHSHVELSAVRTENSPNRVANLIGKAFTQLELRPEPKWVILLNDADLNLLDLKEAVQGYLDYQSLAGTVVTNTSSAHVAQRLKKTLAHLDALLWIERSTSQYSYFCISEEGLGIYQRYFAKKSPAEVHFSWGVSP
ncbi:hypothetical protein [Deinococcus sonorensis]|uniref:Uncharacterized protein n=2 Tax=Deinococcus sonorensis TaxID=309891 RepID=A0AAU7UBF4_9DEIO